MAPAYAMMEGLLKMVLVTCVEAASTEACQHTQE